MRCSPTMLLHTKRSRELSLTQLPKPHPVRCSPTMLLHTNRSRELSLTQVPKPPPCEVFSNNAITYQQEQGGIIHPSTQTHPVRCSPTLLLHTKGSREVSFTPVPKPPPCEVFSYLAITYQREQGGIIYPSTQTPTL